MGVRELMGVLLEILDDIIGLILSLKTNLPWSSPCLSEGYCRFETLINHPPFPLLDIWDIVFVLTPADLITL